MAAGSTSCHVRKPQPDAQPISSTQAKPATLAKPKPKPVAEARLSRQRKPTAMPADDWQRTLRRRFGQEQDLELQNLNETQ